MADLRPEFYEISRGWLLTDDFDGLTDRIERLGKWAKNNQPLTEDESATVSMMIERQIILSGDSLLIKLLMLSNSAG